MARDRPALPEVALIPLTEGERESFLHEEVAGYAAMQVRDAGWAPAEALHRAQAEITSAFDRELAEAMASNDRLWSAKSTDGQTVGWLWVKAIDGGVTSVYLEQITVAAGCRRRGYGRAMLGALEELLAADGVEEVRLATRVANQASLGLYAAAGYEQVSRDEHRVMFRKRLEPARAWSR